MSDENNIPLRQEMFCSPLSVLSRFCHNSPQKRLRNFLRGDIMRKLWGRGSGGRAMRSQRIGHYCREGTLRRTACAAPRYALNPFSRSGLTRFCALRNSARRSNGSKPLFRHFVPYESPRLHQKTARTSCLCGFLLSRGDSAAHSLRRPALCAEPLLPVRADALLRPVRLRAQIRWRKTAIPSLRSLRVPSF